MLQLHLSDQQFICLLKCLILETWRYFFFQIYEVISWDNPRQCVYCAALLLVWLIIFLPSVWTVLTHWGQNEIDDSLQTTVSHAFFFKENILIWIKISLKLIPKVSITNIPALVQIMAWRQPGAKQLSEPIMIILLMHICTTQPQWVNWISLHYLSFHSSSTKTWNSQACYIWSSLQRENH